MGGVCFDIDPPCPSAAGRLAPGTRVRIDDAGPMTGSMTAPWATREPPTKSVIPPARSGVSNLARTPPRGCAYTVDASRCAASWRNPMFFEVTTFAGTIEFFGSSSQLDAQSGNGPAAEAVLFGPFGIAVTPSGAVYVTEVLFNGIRKIEGGVVSTLTSRKEGNLDGPLATALFPR